MKRFKKWLSGKFNCIKCGKSICLMSFGFGDTICPSCFQGEKEFIFLDMSYWLNRLLAHLRKRATQPSLSIRAKGDPNAFRSGNCM